MKTSRKSSSSDKKKLVAIPVLGIVFVGVLATTDWSVLSDSDGVTAQGVTTTSTDSGGSAELSKNTTVANQSSSSTKKLGSGKLGKIEDWSQVPRQSLVDLQPVELEEILAYDPFMGGPTVVVSAPSAPSEGTAPASGAAQSNPQNEAVPEIQNVSAVYIENGKAYAFIQGKVVPVEGHEQLIHRLNRSSSAMGH